MISVADCSVTRVFFPWPMHGPSHKGLEDINIAIGWQLMHLD